MLYLWSQQSYKKNSPPKRNVWFAANGPSSLLNWRCVNVNKLSLHRIYASSLVHFVGFYMTLHNSQKAEKAKQLNVNKGFSFFVLIALPLSSPLRAAFLKSVCPGNALSWPPVRLYQRSLEGRTSAKAREQEEEEGDAVFSHDAPLAKRKRTTPQREMDTHARHGHRKLYRFTETHVDSNLCSIFNSCCLTPV